MIRYYDNVALNILRIYNFSYIFLLLTILEFQGIVLLVKEIQVVQKLTELRIKWVLFLERANKLEPLDNQFLKYQVKAI